MRQALSGIEFATNPNLLVGTKTADDAGVYKISEEIALIQTVDFFTPIVDDPFVFGQIAAANSLSDVYAMGGLPLTALNIVCFPKDDLPLEALKLILEGGNERVKKAKAVVAGGHSVEDKELKFGLSITGQVHPKKIKTNAGAKVGHKLLLTKKLGTGILATAIKRGKAKDSTIDEIVASMIELSEPAAKAIQKFSDSISACTDITGFGFLGHSYEMATGSKVEIEIDSQKIPMFDNLLDFASNNKFMTMGNTTNRAYVGDSVEFAESVEEVYKRVLFDPQTSGGLLIAIASNKVEEFKTAYKNFGGNFICEIGSVTEGHEQGKISVV
ncbi:MAG: selenide, water dikinase SelD [Calditrichaeota bacterium]|nr:MAG: selenide, water dikinase SelD [Calditrichota bacterium]